ncbi:MAG: hypothetical protein J3K34DRAFT_488901 [Monoraphidium minutum]|nr:MAG: hypothetical protein J3K34DRAFT_488901 [Monoraphidium minutum]
MAAPPQHERDAQPRAAAHLHPHPLALDIWHLARRASERGPLLLVFSGHVIQVAFMPNGRDLELTTHSQGSQPPDPEVVQRLAAAGFAGGGFRLHPVSQRFRTPRTPEGVQDFVSHWFRNNICLLHGRLCSLPLADYNGACTYLASPALFVLDSSHVAWRGAAAGDHPDPRSAVAVKALGPLSAAGVGDGVDSPQARVANVAAVAQRLLEVALMW